MSDSKFTHHIIGVSWQDPGVGKECKPYINLRNLATSQDTKLWLEDDYTFQWELTEQRYCPGYRENGKLNSCPHLNPLAKGYDRCAYCESRTGFRATFFFGAEPNENMKEYLAQTHYVYLAYFPPNTVKVGTAADSRKRVRLIEQDALVGLIIAQADGFSIQDLEHNISKQFKLTEAVSSKQKISHVHTKLNLERVKFELEATFQRLHDHYQGTEFKQWFIEPELLVQKENSHIYYPNMESEIHRQQETSILIGDYRGLRGKYLITEIDKDLVAYNKKHLEGRYMRVNQDITMPSSVNTPKSAQLSLFH